MIWCAIPRRERPSVADFLRCWLKIAHEKHGWTDVVDSDGTAHVHSLVDASTVLQVPEGSKARYHHCDGIEDVSEPGGMPLAGQEYKRDYETVVQARVDTMSAQYLELGSQSLKRIIERNVTIEAVYERCVVQTEWVEVQRITCFCCSCGEREGSDPACRNHGFAAVRPCEEHGTPGSVWDADTGDGEPLPDWHNTMPESVQVIRRERRAMEAVDNGG